MTAPASDAEQFRKAEAARSHEARLAQIEADKQIKLAAQRSREREARRSFVGACLVGVAIVLVILAITAALVWNAHGDRAARTRDSRACIDAGNIWTHGDCLIARRQS